MKSCQASLFALAFSALTAHALPGQLTVGFRNTTIVNATKSGSSALTVRVYYPATTAGQNTALLPKKGGYPVIVHLHGRGARASTYPHLGETLARAGFIAVLNDTALTNSGLQLLDGIALYKSLVTENQRKNSVFNGALDMSRAGISGHSMGGGNTVRTLAANPGYKAGFCFAPWDGTIFGFGSSWTKSAPSVRVPLAIVHGLGDTTVSWQRIGVVFYNKASNYTGLKSFVLLNSTAGHRNIVRRSTNASKGDLAVFARSMAMIVGWFDHHLRGGTTGMEDVVGNLVRRDAYFKSISTEYKRPELWSIGSQKIGGTLSLGVGGEPGACAILISSGTKKIQLSFGLLQLDPVLILPLSYGSLGTQRLFSVQFPIPKASSMIGTRLWLQGLTGGARLGLQLTGVVPIVITK